MKNQNINSRFIIFFFIFLSSCITEYMDREILVTTGRATDVKVTKVNLHGEIIDFGEGIDQYGHCWSTNPVPTINDSISIFNEIEDSIFISNISKLEDNTKYFFRSYAQNNGELVYGEINEFTTFRNLIAYYPFNGNTKDDISNDYAYNSGAELTADRFGNSNSAYDFDGLNDYMRLKTSLHATDGLSFSFWVKSKDLQLGESNGTVISRNYAFYGVYCFEINTYNTTLGSGLMGSFFVYALNRNDIDCAWSNMMTTDDIPDYMDASKFDLVNPMMLPLNSWTHCVINVTDTEIQAWINGVLTVKKEREYSSYYFDQNWSSNTYIGNNSYTDDKHFFGSIDDLRVYKVGLTEEEIQLLYHESGWDE